MRISDWSSDVCSSVRTAGGLRGAFYADQYGDCAATSKIFDFAQRHGRQSPDVRPGAGKWMVIERNTERFDLNCPLLVDWKAWHIWACWRVQREQQILSSLTRFEFETGDEMFSGRLSVDRKSTRLNSSH